MKIKKFKREKSLKLMEKGWNNKVILHRDESKVSWLEVKHGDEKVWKGAKNCVRSNEKKGDVNT